SRDAGRAREARERRCAREGRAGRDAGPRARRDRGAGPPAAALSVDVYAPRPARPMADHASVGVAVDPVTLARGWAAATLLRVAPGGVVGAHDAPSAQALRVLQGKGVARTHERVALLEPGVTVLF